MPTPPHASSGAWLRAMMNGVHAEIPGAAERDVMRAITLGKPAPPGDVSLLIELGLAGRHPESGEAIPPPTAATIRRLAQASGRSEPELATAWVGEALNLVAPMGSIPSDGRAREVFATLSQVDREGPQPWPWALKRLFPKAAGYQVTDGWILPPAPVAVAGLIARSLNRPGSPPPPAPEFTGLLRSSMGWAAGESDEGRKKRWRRDRMRAG